MDDKKKPKGRDFPLAPTSNPKAVDNTYVNKPFVKKEFKEVKPTYSMVQADVELFRGGEPYSKKDSSTYELGFKRGRENDDFPYPSAAKSAYTAGKYEGKKNPSPKNKFYKKGK